MPFAPPPSSPAVAVLPFDRGRLAALRGAAALNRAQSFVALEIGQRLRRRRRHLGATLTEIARRAGVSYQQVQRFECGETQISAAMVWRLAEALSVSVPYLFGETTTPEPEPNRPANPASPEGG